ncbi:HVO_0476 family zinc finger protein [Halococcus agarilyticus]|uniref:HVO_0476 family zinc finger protein n=1 Tax=Halococcus agarilyticus TaxID=1232219 RepID=UPI000677729B|nr:HVO_0476 family zinc finger protein [Halococcus agarilyticus]
MSEATERVAVACPSCSPAEPVVHEVLKPGGQTTVRCTECGHTHKTKIEEPDTVECDVIVSQDGESFSTATDVPAGESLTAGEEFVLDTPEALLTVRITSLEVGDDQRSESAVAEDVDTIWTRVVGNVGVDVTLNPSDGDDETRSIELRVPGDYEFTVGEREDLADEAFTVKGIHLRADATGYGFDRLDHDEDMAFAKDVDRLYADDESSGAWSVW